MQYALRQRTTFLQRLPYIVFFLLVVGNSCAYADDNAEANKLFVNTVQIVKKAAVAQPVEAIKLYEQALQNLDHLVATYPGSILAVQIVSGQSIGDVSRTDIEQALLRVQQEARQAECSQHLRASCILDEALETSHSIKDSGGRVHALSAIAVAQGKAGDKVAARRTLATALESTRATQSSFARDLALSDIAAARAKAEDGPTALETARNITESSVRNLTLSDIATAQAEAGDWPTALEAARNIVDSFTRVHALSTIAVAQAKAGDKAAARMTFATALESARSLGDSTMAWAVATRSEALSAIAVAQAKAGDWATALKTARSISGGRDRTLALSAIAVAQAKAGDKAAARMTLATALESTRATQSSFARFLDLSRIAVTTVKLGLE